MSIFKRFIQALGTFKSLYVNVYPEDFAQCGKKVIIEHPCKVTHPKNVYLGNDIAIRGFFTFISHTGKLIIKDHCDIAQHFTVVTGNHTVCPPLNKWQVDCNHTEEGDIEKDIIIEEDVWIGIHVTLLSGITIGRGSIIGAGSVVTKSIPPYSIAVGNPCHVIRHKFNIHQVIEREQLMFSPSLRLSINKLREIYEKV